MTGISVGEDTAGACCVLLGLKPVHLNPVVSISLLFDSGCGSTVISQHSREKINELVLGQMSSIVDSVDSSGQKGTRRAVQLRNG